MPHRIARHEDVAVRPVDARERMVPARTVGGQAQCAGIEVFVQPSPLFGGFQDSFRQIGADTDFARDGVAEDFAEGQRVPLIHGQGIGIDLPARPQDAKVEQVFDIPAHPRFHRNFSFKKRRGVRHIGVHGAAEFGRPGADAPFDGDIGPFHAVFAGPVLVGAHRFAAVIGVAFTVGIDARHAAGRSGLGSPPAALEMFHSQIHDGFRVRRLDAAGSDDADGFQVFGPEDASESAGAGADAASMDQRCDSRHRFAHRPDAHDLRPGGSVLVFDLAPFLAEAGPSGNGVQDLSLRFIGVQAPQVLGVFDRHLVIDDVDPDGPIGFPLDGDAVPSRQFQHGGEPAAKAGAMKQRRREGFGTDAADAGSPGARNARRRQRAGHQGNDVSGIKGVLQIPVSRGYGKLPEKGCADADPAAEFLVQRRIERGDFFRRQVDLQYFSRVSIGHGY